jgi:8-amino-7-oxononanoate synthase
MAVQRLAEMKARGVQRRLTETIMGPGQRAAYVDGHDGELISFCSNDYLGLSRHPRVIAAAQRALAEDGAGAGASRLVTGNYTGLELLEMSLATLKSNESALVFGSGYLANIGTIPTIAEDGDLILIDELAHACQIAGTRLSKARTVVFRHNDMGHLSDLLKTERPQARHCLIVSEGVFSMDGDLAPWPEIKALAEGHDAWTMIDDAHGTGVLGNGRGFNHHWRMSGPDILMGTLSKALGSYGGFIVAEKQIIQLVVSRAPSFIFATALPPASAAAALEAINVLYDAPGLCDIPLAHAAKFCYIAGLPPPSSQIVPLILGSAEKAVAASNLLAREGFLVTAIRPPTVPEGTSRLRFTFAADHREADVGRLGARVRDLIMKDRRP